MSTPDQRVSMDERLRTNYDWTPRQRQVLDLLAAGRSNPEIADRLGISRDGAKYHISEVLSKLGVDSREEAAEYWRRHQGLRPRFARMFRSVAGGTALKLASGVAAVAGAAAVVALIALNGDDETPVAGLKDEPTPSAAVNAQPVERWWYRGTDQYARVAASSAVVVVVGGRTDDRGRGTGGTVTLLDRDTGAERWKVDVDCAPLYPAVDAKNAYFPCTDGTVRALNIEDGDEAWRHGPDGAAVFLIADGKRVYAVDGDPESYDLDSVDPPLDTDGRGRVRAFDSDSGATAWEVTSGAWTGFIALEGSTLFAATSGGNADSEALAIQSATGDVLWRTPLAGSANSRPFVSDDAIYVAHGELSRLNRDDGAVRWTKEVPSGGTFQAPVALGELVVAGTNVNSMYSLSAADGSILTKGQYCDCPYSASRRGDMVLVSGNALALVEPGNLDMDSVWFRVPQGQFAMTVTVDGWIFAPASSNPLNTHVAAFR